VTRLAFSSPLVASLRLPADYHDTVLKCLRRKYEVTQKSTDFLEMLYSVLGGLTDLA